MVLVKFNSLDVIRSALPAHVFKRFSRLVRIEHDEVASANSKAFTGIIEGPKRDEPIWQIWYACDPSQ